MIDSAIVKDAPAVGADRAPAWLWSGTLAAALALLLLGTLGRAVGKPLWHDEIFTLYIAAQPAAADIWRALAAGVDLNPPFYHLLVHGAIALLGPGALAVRLPATAGFLLASACLYAFVRFRADRPFALFAALLPSLTGAYMYAYEGRPYGLVLGLTAAAVLAWQRRDSAAWRPWSPVLCGVAVAAATYTHYYAGLVLVPLVAGELVRAGTRRRIDWPMWSAFALGGLSAIGLLPLVRSARGFGATFWSRPALGDLVGFYALLTEPLSLVLLAAAMLVTILSAVPTWRPPSAVAAKSLPVRGWNLPLDETAAMLVLLAVPVVGYLVAVFVTGAFHERYLLYGVLGFAVLASAWLRALPLARRQLALFVFVCLLAFAARQGGGVLALTEDTPDPLAGHRALLEQLPPDVPVVVSHALTFLPLAHYAGAQSDRLTYLTRPPDVVRRSGVDTGGRALERLSTIVPLDVQEYEAFIREQRQFFVYGPASWLLPQLLRDGANVELLRQSGEMSLFRVAMFK